MAKPLRNELLIATMTDLFTAVDRVGLTLADALLISDLTESQFKRGLQLARRNGHDIRYDAKDKHYRLSIDYEGGVVYEVGRLRDMSARQTTNEGFLAGFAMRHPDHEPVICLTQSTVRHAKEQMDYLVRMLEDA